MEEEKWIRRGGTQDKEVGDGRLGNEAPSLERTRAGQFRFLPDGKRCEMVSDLFLGLRLIRYFDVFR